MPRRPPAHSVGARPTVVRIASFRPPLPASTHHRPLMHHVPAQRAPVSSGADNLLRRLQTPLRLVLPLPPSINHQYATVGGRRILSAAARRFKTDVAQEILLLLSRQRPGPAPGAISEGAPLALDLHFYFSSGFRRDIDGGLKITQDALCEALGVNDNRIITVTLRKDIDPERPRMELSLRPAARQAP